MQEATLWKAVLGEIELTISRGNYVTWFKNTRLLRKNGNKYVVGVPNVFIKNQLERKYNQLIVDSISNNGESPEKVEYKIYAAATLHKKIDDDQPVILEASQSDTTSERPSSSLTHSYRQGLNERYTFDSFIVGSANDLAYAACQAVAQSIGTKYNPLFVYGGVGIGKTHLIQAVGNAILAKNPSAHIVYISTEQFVQEFLDAIRFKKNTDFASFYRSADVLIIDDMQFIAGKEKTQEEFFHTFNALHQANKQIIISSDKPPRSIPTLTDRLRSRFEMGMSIDMQNPDFETRCVIVQSKASAHNFTLDQDVVEYLANFVQTNIRELEGALNKVLATCEMRGIQPDLMTTTAVLGEMRNRPKHISAKQIIERTARHYQIELEDILGPKRDREIVVPRQVAMYLLRSELHLSFPKIARELGRKDHTTAIHSIDKIEKEQSFDGSIKVAIEEIREKLHA